MFEILDIDPAALTDAEQNTLLRSTAIDRNRLDAAECRLLTDWDTRKVWAADGAHNGAAWLRNQTGCPIASARERLRVARRLRHMPHTAAAFTAGELSYEKVRLLAGLRTDATAAAFDPAEAQLVGWARRFDAGELAKVTRYWKAMADAAGLADDAKAQNDAQQASLSETLAGMFRLDGWFAPEDGHTLQREIDQLMDDLHRQELRDRQNGIDVPLRTPAQRRAAAIVEMARRSAANPDGRHPRPDLGVLIPLDTLHGAHTPARFADGAPLTPDTARRLACDAAITRIITGPNSEILDLGRHTPVPNTAQRRATALRDAGCTFASCDLPAARCAVHHLIPYARGRPTGGATDLDNLTLVCHRHHRLVHEHGFTMRRDPATGTVETRRPDGTLISNRPRAGPLGPCPGRCPPPQAPLGSGSEADPGTDPATSGSAASGSTASGSAASGSGPDDGGAGRRGPRRHRHRHQRDADDPDDGRRPSGR